MKQRSVLLKHNIDDQTRIINVGGIERLLVPDANPETRLWRLAAGLLHSVSRITSHSARKLCLVIKIKATYSGHDLDCN